MADVLIAVLASNGELPRRERAAIGFGLELAVAGGAACDVVVLGPGAAGAARGIGIAGLRSVAALSHADLDPLSGEAIAAAVEQIVRARSAGGVGYRVVASVTNSLCREALPRLAARLGAAMASDVIGVEPVDAEQVRLRRAVFAGNLHAIQELSTPLVVATCRASSFTPPEPGQNDAPVETIALTGPLAHPRKRIAGARRSTSERPDLADARIVVSIGRGAKGPNEGVALAAELADVLGAALGASRAVVDAGWLPNDLQVGQTGKVVAPELYIAIGLSGAIQHLAGMRQSKTIVAINRDAEAPIFGIADYGWVADLFVAVPELIEALRGARR